MKYLLLFFITSAAYSIQTEAPRPSRDENHQDHIKDSEAAKEDARKNQLKRQKNEELIKTEKEPKDSLQEK